MKYSEIIIALSFFIFLIPAVILAQSESVYKLYPIGKVHKEDGKVFIEIYEQYKNGLLGLDEFSHVTVVYWFDKNDTPEKRKKLITSRVSKGRNVGVFATHSPVRPNLIAISNCRIKSIKENRLYIDDIDAFDNSPVLDLKCFIPYTYDKKEEKFIIPEWVKEVIRNNKKK